MDIQINEHELFFDNLPEEFDGYRIMHLSDLHIDELDDIKNVVSEHTRSLKCDLCAITGDYRGFIFGKHLHLYDSLQYVKDNIHATDGIFATMGNHDSSEMLPYLEASGFNMLLNETIRINRGNAFISVTGVDDPYYFYSERIESALESSGDGFKILLVHAPELFKSAAENNFSLYLCGHTHGGQICFPWGRPLYINLRKSKNLHSGLWQYQQLKGYTSTGTGVCTMPVRYFTRGEIAVFTLRKTKL